MELFHAIIDSGGLELILAAPGLGAAVRAFVMYKRWRKEKKMTEQILG
jgi:hypothetical protein